VLIKHNYIDNLGAESGSHIQYGIFSGGLNTQIKNNVIKNFVNINSGTFLNIHQSDEKSSGGIYCVYGNQTIINNKLINNNVGILMNPSAFLSSYQLESNYFEKVATPYYPATYLGSK
jgi:hypothetical protein